VRGIGLSGQMHGMCLLSADRKPLTPFIGWQDRRSDDWMPGVKSTYLLRVHELAGNLPPSLMTNTSIKLAGGVSDRDARVIAPEMRTRPEFLSEMTKSRTSTEFAAFVRNVTPQALKMTVPFGTAERMVGLPFDACVEVRAASRVWLSTSVVQPSQAADEPKSQAPAAAARKHPTAADASSAVDDHDEPY
jgi:hypothetical protein